MTFHTTISPAMGRSLLLMAGLGACSSGGIDPNDPPAHCKLDRDRLVQLQKGVHHNRLSTNAIMFNALTGNRKAQQQMLEQPLASETYAVRASCLNDSAPDDECYLGAQLQDAWTLDMFHFIAVCALPVGDQISWTHPVTGETHTYHGEQGLCPKWARESIADVSVPENRACQELVSACVLASNNAHGQLVRISLHGQVGDAPIPWTGPAYSYAPDEVASGRACDDPASSSSSASSTGRDCGWNVEPVGTCQPGMPVTLRPGDTCRDQQMVRVCGGKLACDADDSVAAQSDFCAAGALVFDCPAGGRFTVMTAAENPQAPPQVNVQAERAVYPVAEEVLFSAREGAFYGNMFEWPDGASPLIGVEVQGGAVTYTYPDASGELVTFETYDTTCDQYNVDHRSVQAANHQSFLNNVGHLAEMFGTDEIPLYPNLYACHDPAWTRGEAYATKRSCAGPDGDWKFCAARPTGQCWNSERSADDRCLTEDDGNGGDRDYGRCRGGGRVWEHPLTVFLDDPCSVVTDTGVCHMRRLHAVAAGNNHTCVIIGEAREHVRCWGRGSEYQLGLGDREHIGDDEYPAAVAAVAMFADGETPQTIEQIVAGGLHTCARLDDGRVRCWGDNRFGQLGYPDRAEVARPRDAGDVPIGGRAVMLAAGQTHTCALLDDDSLHCWGNGDSGRLGRDGDPADPSIPVDMGNAKPLDVTAGDAHTCVRIAGLSGARVRCFGEGEHGRLGYGDSLDQPRPPARDIAIGGVVKQVVAGLEHTCVLLDIGDDNGRVRCFGNGADGRLGYGRTQDIGDDEHPDEIAPLQLGGVATALVAGAAHTCAVLASGAVRCWGSGTSGRLGTGLSDDIGDDELPVASIPAELGYGVLMISAGTAHTCAILAVPRTGLPTSLRCWGAAAYGRLGYRSDSDIGDDEWPAAVGDVPVL